MNLVPDDEWDAFLAALKEPLPVTFRVTGFRTHAFAVMQLIRERYFQPLESSTAIEKPKELVWYDLKCVFQILIIVLFYRYPGSLAWQLNLSRNQLRSSPELQKLKEFLYEQTEHVNYSNEFKFFNHLLFYFREILVVKVRNYGILLISKLFRSMDNL